MTRKRILWQLYPSYILVILLAVVALAWYSIESQGAFYLQQTESDLTARARLVEGLVAEPLRSADHDAVDRICKHMGTETATRITVVLPSGEVVGDSQEEPGLMEPHDQRPEILEARAGEVGASVRFSNTLRKNMMYVALRIASDGQLLGYVRTAVPITFIDQARRDIRWRVALAGLAIAFVAALVSLYVSRRIARPLEDLRRGAERFAQGDLSRKLPVPETEEIGGLAEAMNLMVEQLNERIQTITRQRNEQEAILASMVEGVIAVDNDERVININKAAARFFGLDPAEIHGRIIHEIIRNSVLQQLVSGVLENRESMECEIQLGGRQHRTLQASGTILQSASREAIGAVIVLNDISRVRELENVRRDFVANVSHELKTPITSIKGFVETLLDSPIRENEDAERFLGIIAKHADRLNSIIDDLLSLSRIEQGPEITFEYAFIEDVLHSAAIVCAERAKARDIRLNIECEEGLRAEINPHLLEQAIVNLVDNAVKYSPGGNDVVLRAARRANEFSVDVQDHGIGIEPQHLSRVFERFYRVDRARSRELGGTGLGLAIVKHIALAHEGRVSVDSTPGAGSTFTITIPVHRLR